MVNRFQFEADQYQIFAKYVFFGAAKTNCLTVLVNLLKLQDLCNCTLQMQYLILCEKVVFNPIFYHHGGALLHHIVYMFMMTVDHKLCHITVCQCQGSVNTLLPNF